MSKNNQKRKQEDNTNKSKKNVAIIASIVIVLIVAIFVFKGSFSGNNKVEAKTAASGADLVIPISEVSEKAKFYPYSVDGIKMEVVALKASDGTIRTALNTCQVCYASGRGYYEQEGDVLVCQNCGNRFQADQVEKIKGGCNPVPIMKENKTENETDITISKDFLALNTELFLNWKTK
ncbi:MAG: Fe-S-containing protein [Ruminiclostridium sp.]